MATHASVETVPEPRTGTAVIAIAGEVDGANCLDMQQQIAELMPGDDHTGVVALDLSGLSFLGSAGMRSLVACGELAEQRGCRLVITRAHDNVRMVLRIVGLTDYFQLPEE